MTNALLHAQTELTLHVLTWDDTVRIAIDDGSSAEPRSRVRQEAVAGGALAASTAMGGRGLPLVEMLADRWGWEPLPTGKRVWFEL